MNFKYPVNNQGQVNSVVSRVAALETASPPLWIPKSFTAADCAGGLLPEGWWAAGGVAADTSPVVANASGVVFTGSAASQFMNVAKFNAPMIMAHCPRYSGDYTMTLSGFPSGVNNNFGMYVSSGGFDADHHYAGVYVIATGATHQYYMIEKPNDTAVDTAIANQAAPLPYIALTTVGIRLQWSGTTFKVWIVQDGVETAMNGGAAANWSRVAGTTPFSQGGGRTIAITAGAGPFTLSAFTRNG